MEWKENGERVQQSYSVGQIILAVIMLAIGSKYSPRFVEEFSGNSTLSGASTPSKRSVAPLPKEIDPCPNGAAYFLYAAGIVILVMNLVNIQGVSIMAQRGSGGKFGLFFTLGSAILVFVHCIMVIWGSVVVFGAWGTWTDDYAEYVADTKNKNYCAHEPMMFAFVILIIKWVWIPCLVVFFGACTAMCICAANAAHR